MNPKSPMGVRASATGLALAVGTLAAVPTAMAEHYTQPYYDPVRDVMVTPLASSTATTPRGGYGPSPVLSSPGAVGVTREPIYGTVPPTSRQFYGSARPVPGIQVVPESSAGLAQQPSAGIAPSAAWAPGYDAAAWQRVYAAAPPEPSMPRSYYDPVRDVMITPPQYPAVRYSAASQDSRVAMTHGPEASFDLIVRNGGLVQGPTAMTVDHGTAVTLVVDSNVADTLSIDGYNLTAPIAAGQPTLLRFVAEQPGRFAYRLGSGRPIGVLEVGPAQPGSRIGMR